MFIKSEAPAQKENKRASSRKEQVAKTGDSIYG
jgi:hypothetical protein